MAANGYPSQTVPAAQRSNEEKVNVVFSKKKRKDQKQPTRINIPSSYF
jgi:hypothetical protein